MSKFIRFFFLLLSIWLPTSLFFQILAQSYTDADRIKMRKEAESLIELYEFGLNQIGSNNERDKRWREDDINNILENYFENPNTRVYDDLGKIDRDSLYLSAREYLEKINQTYNNGARFQYSLNLKNPCFQKIGQENFYLVKIEISKRIEGILEGESQPNIREDSLDAYIKFPILQNRPNLVTGPAKISSIQAHLITTCQDTFSINPVAIDDFENTILQERAENFVKDYAITLNIIGNPKINERFNTTDYFETKNVSVYNDLIPIILLEEFTADDYLNNIELWYQEGIVFDYKSIRATNVLTEENYVSVEVEVDRVIKVPARNYRNRQQIGIYVKFPIDTDGRVGAERITPRIYKIVEKKKKLNPKNYLAIGGQLGIVSYFGDLNPINQAFRPEYRFIRPVFGVHITQKINDRFFLRLAYNRGRIFGDDHTSSDPQDDLGKFRFIRNLHFRNTINEFSLVGIYEWFPNTGLYYKRRRISPYAFGGLALFHHNPEAKTPVELGAAWIKLKPLRTEGQGGAGNPRPYSNFQVAFPVGLGVRFRLNYRIDLSFEIGARYTLFDYLDDVSSNYVDPGELSTDLARIMANRSLENFSAFGGESRVDALEILKGDLPQITFRGRDGNTYETINGFGRRGEQRGGKNSNDLYLITAFHLSYLLRVGKTESIRQKPKFRIDFN